MKTLDELLTLVKKANKKQLNSMIYDFGYLGFYREDKRQQRNFIVECLVNNYTTDKNIYGILDSDSVFMEKSVLEAMNS